MLQERFRVGIETLAKQWARADPPAKEGGCTVSTAFGKNDILTLCWHLDLFGQDFPLKAIQPNEAKDIYQKLIEILFKRINEYSKAQSGYSAVVGSFSETIQSPERRVSDSAYNLLWFIRGALKAKPQSPKQVGDAVTTMNRAVHQLRTRLHEELSLSAITNSRFDAAELIFCLEGMLHLRLRSVDDALLDRIITVVEKNQEARPQWASTTPIVSNHKGQVLYPTSVEIARSLLASISIIERDYPRTNRREALTSRLMILVKKYWIWLKHRKITIRTPADDQVTGWHSEHLMDTALIHTWETSQILEFCVVFREQMRKHVSATLLMASRLAVDWPKLPSDCDWDKVAKEYEPVTCLGTEHEVYADIGEKFVKPHLTGEGEKRFWSMLMSGPPGTGKSALAERISAALGVPFITVTVSDFLAEGEARMENRAKLVFEVLKRQVFSVVLFDEFDQFLLDRDSVSYKGQDSAFQFLTPGMLTKIAELRKRQNVIFIVATNYEERIDPAIKRAGRIDLRYILLPPDSAARFKIMQASKSISIHLKALDPKIKRNLLVASAFLGFKEIELVSKQEVVDVTALITSLERAPRNIKFGSYRDRFGVVSRAKDEIRVDLSAGPEDELILLFRLAKDAWSDQNVWDRLASECECGRSFMNVIVTRLLNSEADDTSRASFVGRLEEDHGITVVAKNDDN